MNGNIYNGDAARLHELYKEYYGENPIAVEKLPGAGSARAYYRLRGEGISSIGTVCDNRDDRLAFVELSKIFRKRGIRVPEVFIATDDCKYYLQQDLGSESLLDYINKCRKENAPGEHIMAAVKNAVTELIRIQNIDLADLEYGIKYSSFSPRQIMWDLNYFKYEYLKSSGIDFDENGLEDDFESFAKDLMDIAKLDCGFMYRDFQSRNVIMHDGESWLIDFQGGRIGPRIYDVVSFLWQAKADFSDSFRIEILDYYRNETIRELEQKDAAYPFSATEFKNAAMKMALFRTLQVLGAYGLRGFVERKAHFIESIPGALRNLSELIKSGLSDSYPVLKGVCEKICMDPRFNANPNDGLTVTVFSFSYKKGYPADYSGNGGGFMFDCRGMHNPGRYDVYKPLTGRDKAVIDYLEEKGEVQKFTSEAFDIIAPTIERYLKRGFNSLQVGFGCTGGRHRSVYCAEKVANQLAEKFPAATVKLIHREQDIIIDKL